MISRLKLIKSAALSLTAAVFAVPARGQASIGGAGIHYQGRLTAPDGTAVTDGSWPVVFRLYDVPTGGSTQWEESATVATRAGAFATMLGRSSSFPADLFSRPLWLEIEVNGRRLVPRQELGAAPYAMSALSMPAGAVGTAQIVDLSVTSAKIADGAVTKQKLAADLLIPVGTVVSWWGDSANPPVGWKVCDGTVVSDSQSPLNGSSVPDLRDKFVRGATGNVRSALPVGGANDHTLTVEQMPSHGHGVTDPGHQHDTRSIGWGAGPGNESRPRLDGNSPQNAWDLWSDPSHTGISIQPSGGGQAFSILPTYVGLIYIVRIR